MSILGVEVPLGKIAKELKTLWADDTSRTNASLMNFAVFTEDVDQLEQNYHRISKLTENHSCRALSIALDRNASEESITSWVSAHCNMSNGKKTVCCEHLSFLLKGYVTGRMRNTVFSNLNSDLPLVFWWQGELTDVFEPRLYTLIDRFIFDSNEWASPKEGYATLLNALEDSQKRLVIQDLAWTVSYNVRLAFAAMFDEAIAQSEFSNIKEASIQVGEGYLSSGLLLVAWLANQAGWKFICKVSTGYHFENAAGEPIHIALNVKGTHPISELGVASENGSFLVKQNPNENYLHQVTQTDCGTSELTTSAGTFDDVSLVADQLSRGGKNALLRKTLPLYLELLDA